MFKAVLIYVKIRNGLGKKLEAGRKKQIGKGVGSGEGRKE